MFKAIFPAVLFGSILLAASVHASVQIHSFPFVESIELGDPEVAQNLSMTGNLVEAGFFSSTAPSFDSSLGTLNSVSIVWSIGAEASGQVSSDAGVTSGGFSISSGASGNFFVDGDSYDGNGSGTGASNGPGGDVADSFNYGSNYVLDSGNEGSLFLNDFLDTTAGDTIVFSHGSSIGYQFDRLTEFAMTTEGELTVTYDYTPVPESSAFAAIASIFACGLVVLRRRHRCS